MNKIKETKKTNNTLKRNSSFNNLISSYNKLEVKFIKNINEILEEIFINNTIKFNYVY